MTNTPNTPAFCFPNNHLGKWVGLREEEWPKITQPAYFLLSMASYVAKMAPSTIHESYCLSWGISGSIEIQTLWRKGTISPKLWNSPEDLAWFSTYGKLGYIFQGVWMNGSIMNAGAAVWDNKEEWSALQHLAEKPATLRISYCLISKLNADRMVWISWISNWLKSHVQSLLISYSLSSWRVASHEKR